MGKRLLIVDDEPDILYLLSLRLKANGYDTLTAQGGGEALQLIRDERPDLVLLDVNIPAPNGYDVCKSVKDDGELKHIPIIFLTAKAAEDDMVCATDSGADDYITKPYHPEELLSKIKRLLA